MSDQLTNNPEALRLFFTEDIYLVDAAQTRSESLDVADMKAENTEGVGNAEKTAVIVNPAGSITLDQAPAIPASTIPLVDIPVLGVPVLVPAATPLKPEVQAEPEVLAKTDVPAKLDISAEAPIAVPAEQGAAIQSFQYVGANERNILILVNDLQHPVSTLQGRELLGNILKAIGLSRNDCALVNYASCNGADFSAFQSFFKPQYVFAFGVSPEQLRIPAAAYNSIVVKDDSKLIFSSNLDVLSGDATTKKLLWGSLKQIQL